MKVLISALLLTISMTLVQVQANAQNSSVAIGDATPKSNAVLYLKSPGGNQGLIIPIVSTPGAFGETGMIVYGSVDKTVFYHDGTKWNAVGTGSGGGNTYTLSLSGNSLILKDASSTVSTVPIAASAPTLANQFLMWDGAKWIATSFSQDVANANGVITVNGIKGKTLPALPSSAQALVYNGTAWVFQALTGGTDSQDLTLNTTTNVLSLTNDATTVDLSAYKQTLSASGTGTVANGESFPVALSSGGTVTIKEGSNVQIDQAANVLTINSVAGGSGTVTNVSVASLNGVSGTVTNPTTTPAITVSLGAITPTSVAATGTVTGSNLSGTNTGDQINITGNAATVTTNANLTGNVTSVGNTTTIQPGVVTNAMLTNVPTATFKGRTTAGTGAPEDLTVAQAKTLLNLSGTNTGDQTLNSLLPSQAGNNGKFLTTDATNASWQSIPGGGDMLLGTSQTVTGNKIYSNGTLLLRNVANTFNGVFTNSNTADRTYTLKDGNGIIAFTSDITGTNSGVNTGDQTTITGNAGTATTLQTGRTISLTGDVSYTSPSFNGSANVTAAAIVTRINGNTVPANASGALTNDGAGTLTWTPIGGSGTVTSVGLSMPTIFTVTGSPLTTSGTLTTTLASQAAATVFAAPSGSAGAPTFRAIVSTDIPTLNQNTTGSAASWTTARLLAGNSVNGTANVPFANKFIVQGTTDAGLSGAQFLGALPTGLVKNTTTTGILSVGVAATDYVAPSAYASSNGLTMSTARLLGRTTASTGAAEEISIGANLSMTGGVLSATGGMTNPLTTTGDIIYGVGTTPTRLAGAAGVLKSTGAAAPAWGAVNLANTDVTGTLPVANGGTGGTTWNGLLLGSGSTIGDITTGSAGQILKVAGTTPTWTNFAVTSADITDGQITGADLATNINITTTGNITTNAPGNLSIAGTSTLGGVATLSNLAGAGTRMVVASPTGVLSTQAVPVTGWGLTGNTGTTPATNFIGTSDSQDLAFKTNATEVMRIVTSGDLGIGIAAPTSRLHLHNAAVAGNFMKITHLNATAGITIGNSGSGGKEAFIANNENAAMYFQTNALNRMAIDAAGNIGMGIIAPTQKLDVVGNVKFSGALMPNNLPGAAGEVLTSAGPGVAPTWAPGGGGGWSLTGNAGTVAGTNFIGTTDLVDLSFKTNNLQRVTIDNAGRVRLQPNNSVATAPAVTNAILDIVPTGPAGGGIGNMVLRGSNQNQNDPVDIEFKTWDGTTTLAKISVNPSASDLWLDANGSTRLALKNDGTVGIGTTSPTQKLDVVGNINVSSASTYMIGASTVLSNTGTANIFVGANSGLFNTAGQNTFVGTAAGRDNTSGSDNTFFGRNAGLVNTTGTLNVIVGSGAGQASTGSGNTFVGYRAGFVNVAGVRNTLIGREADVASAGLTNAIAIGYQAVAGASNTMVLGGTGANAVNVGIGTSTPHAPLHISSSATEKQIILFETANNEHQYLGFGYTGLGELKYQVGFPANDHVFFSGNGTSASTELMRIKGTGLVGIGRAPTTNQLEISGNASKAAAGGWLANSDRRIKTDIRDIDNSLELIKSIRPVKYKYTEEWKRRNPSIKDQYYYSFIAQEYQKVFPEAVQGSGEYLDGDKNEILQIDTHNAQIVTIKAVQEQQKIIETQQTEIDNLKKELAEIKNYLSMEAKVVKKKKGRK